MALRRTLTWAIIAVTAIVSFTAYVGMTIGPRGLVVDIGPLYPVLALTKEGVANGELWRLLTVALVHSPGQIEFFMHLGFNMYALYIVGPAVETIYGARRMLFMYLTCAVTGSVASFVFSPPYPFAVGASGAIFGLFGVLFIASRVHHPLLARRERAIMTQVGTLIVLNLAIGFGLGGVTGIDNAAHVGGLLGGVWLGLDPAAGRRAHPVLDVAGDRRASGRLAPIGRPAGGRRGGPGGGRRDRDRRRRRGSASWCGRAVGRRPWRSHRPPDAA